MKFLGGQIKEQLEPVVVKMSGTWFLEHLFPCLESYRFCWKKFITESRFHYHKSENVIFTKMKLQNVMLVILYLFFDIRNDFISSRGHFNPIWSGVENIRKVVGSVQHHPLTKNHCEKPHLLFSDRLCKNSKSLKIWVCFDDIFGVFW